MPKKVLPRLSEATLHDTFVAEIKESVVSFTLRPALTFSPPHSPSSSAVSQLQERRRPPVVIFSLLCVQQFAVAIFRRDRVHFPSVTHFVDAGRRADVDYKLGRTNKIVFPWRKRDASGCYRKITPRAYKGLELQSSLRQQLPPADSITASVKYTPTAYLKC